MGTTEVSTAFVLNLCIHSLSNISVLSPTVQQAYIIGRLGYEPN